MTEKMPKTYNKGHLLIEEAKFNEKLLVYNFFFPHLKELVL